MPFHVPFNQREARRSQRDPIYIGFDSPAAPPRTPFNWWGFNGMWLSFVSLLSLGFLSIIPFLISLIGLRRPGKSMATVGTIVSLGGMLLAGSMIAGKAHHEYRAHQNRERAIAKRQLVEESKETNRLMKLAREDLIEFRGANDGALPEDLEGNMMVVSYIDAWGESLRFESGEKASTIRSAGPDGAFRTGDDLTVQVKGKTEAPDRHVPVSVPMD